MEIIGYDHISADEQKIYHKIKQGLDKYESVIHFGSMTGSIDPGRIMYTILSDYPEYIYFDKTKFYIGSDHSGGNYIKLYNPLPPLQAKRKMEQLKNRINEINSEIDSMFPDSDYERLLFIYQYFQSHYQYDRQELKYLSERGDVLHPDSHNAYGVLIGGEGVCDGLASALAAVLKSNGYICTTVMGKAKLFTDIPAEHSWVMVKINNSYCHIDLTWDMSDSVTYAGEYSYQYFCTDDKFMESDHQWDKSKIPEALSMNYSYFTKKGLYAHTVDQLDYILNLIAKSKRKYFQIIADKSINIGNQNFEDFIIAKLQTVSLKHRGSVSMSYKWNDSIRCLTCQYN